jgi:hypothetical protein
MAEKHSVSSISNDNEKLLDRLKEIPRKCIPISTYSGRMAAYKNYLLYCPNDDVQLLDEEAGERMKMTLEFDIDDICWSSSLNQLLVLSKKELYSLNLDTREVILLTIFDNVWSQFTINDDTLIVSISNRETNMEVYRLTDWKLLQKFKPPVSVKDNQYPTQIQFNSSGTQLAVALAGGNQRVFELRNPNDMTVLHSVDLGHFNGCTSCHMCYLPNDEFLVNAFLENQIALIDSNGNLKKNMVYNSGKIMSATLINGDKKCFVLRVGTEVQAEKDDFDIYELRFFDLQ